LVRDANSGTVETRVETGLSNGTYVEVVKGLNEGDQVEVQYTASSTQQVTTRQGGIGSIFGGISIRLGR